MLPLPSLEALVPKSVSGAQGHLLKNLSEFLYYLFYLTYIKLLLHILASLDLSNIFMAINGERVIFCIWAIEGSEIHRWKEAWPRSQVL